MEALVGQEAQFVSNPVRKAEPVKSVKVIIHLVLTAQIQRQQKAVSRR